MPSPEANEHTEDPDPPGSRKRNERRDPGRSPGPGSGFPVVVSAGLLPVLPGFPSSPAWLADWIPPELQWGIGFVLLFAGGVGKHCLLVFSPGKALMKVEKKLPPGGRDRLEEELDNAEILVPSAAFLQFLGFVLALLGGFEASREGGSWPEAPLGIILLLLLLPLVGAILPQQIASLRAETIVLRTLPLLRGLRLAFLPFTWILERTSGFLIHNVCGIRREGEPQDRDQLADEIRAAVEDSDEEETLAEEEKEWIENIVGFRDEDVAGVMTPRTEIVGIEADTPFAEAVKTAVEAGHSRLPVFEERLDKVVGIFYLRDAVARFVESRKELLSSPVSRHMRPAYFVPETKKLGDLLTEFRSKRLQIAIVLDEYGGTSGLICLEDLLEEIVGEIEDEYDPEKEAPLSVLEEGRLLEIDARLRVHELNEILEPGLPESEDYETVGGFVFSHLGRIPASGEDFTFENLRFTVLGADERRIERLRVELLSPERSSSHG